MAEVVGRKLRRVIAGGQLRGGDFLPTEARLMHEFNVSRATLREALRVLESDGLIEVRPGARSGARVCVPGPETVARPAALLLQTSHATIIDVMVASASIEATAARLLAKHGTPQAFVELQQIVTHDMPAAWASRSYVETIKKFHRRIVELTGNATLTMFAGLMHEILERQPAEVVRKRPNVPKSQYDELICSYHHLLDLMREGDGDEAEKYFRRQMDTTRKLLLINRPTGGIRDIVD
jgi:DNA-binding FadR family transcriptional regulator